MARQRFGFPSTAILLLLPVLAGCQSSLEQIKSRGATALGCKLEQVSAETLPDANYIVHGCGKSIGYACKETPEGYISCRQANVQSKELGEIRLVKGDLPAGCADLGPIQVGDPGLIGELRTGTDYEVLYGEFKARVLQLGGNFGRLDAQDKAMLRGVAFRCPPPAK